MPPAEFNKDMNSYIKQRSTHSDYSYLEAREEPSQPAMMPDTESHEEYDSEPEHTEPRTGFFSRVKKFFGSDDEPPRQEEPPVEELDIHESCRDDIKQLGKIALDILRALPDKELVGFKNSDQYAQLKRILGKHNLIKSE